MQHAAASDPLIGVTIGNYQVKAKLGEGGMGSVYLAEHPLIGKKVALKVLHSEFSNNEDVAGRFFDEARAVNEVRHPNIVDVVDYGIIPQRNGRTVYFIMEFLDGPSLGQLMKREQRLQPERALAIAFQIADALSASHRAGIVHRDLKPDNVMLIRRGRELDFVKVLDFGIAKLTGDQSVSRKTRTGVIMGTPQYMSPEQCDGRGMIDYRTDIYSLGILLYEMLTGQVPFKGEGYGQVLVQHMTQPPPMPSSITPVIPQHVEAVVLKALAKHPDARYPTMDEFMKAIADPVGYVEAHGGITPFLEATLAPTSMQTPISVPGAPNPLASQRISSIHTASSGLVPTLATHGSAATQPSGSRFWIIGLVCAVAIGVGAGAYIAFFAGSEQSEALAGNRSGETKSPNATTDPPVAPDKRPGTEAKPAGTGAVEPDGPDKLDKTPEVTPLAPEKVKINVGTHPDGAAVYVNDEAEPRGVTPISFELEKSDEPVTLTVKRNGFKPQTRTFTPEIDKGFELQLKRSKRKSRVKKKKKKPNGQSDSDDPDNDTILEEPEF